MGRPARPHRRGLRNRRQRPDYPRIMACMVLFTALFLLWTANFWKVQRVDIEGASAYTEQFLQDFVASEQLRGQHLLTINPLIIREALLHNPLLKQVNLERELWPTRLVFDVQERQPRYRIYTELPQRSDTEQAASETEKSVTIIDAEGIVLPLKRDPLPEQKLAVFIAPDKLRLRLADTQLHLMHQLSALYKAERLKADGVFDISNPQNLIFHQRDPKLEVWLGRPEDILLKIQMIDPARKAAKVSDKEISYLDLRSWKHPVPVLKTQSKSPSQARAL